MTNKSSSLENEEDPLPHDLADSEVERPQQYDDGVEKSFILMAECCTAHRPGNVVVRILSTSPPTSFDCAGCFINRGKLKRKPIWARRESLQENPEKDSVNQDNRKMRWLLITAAHRIRVRNRADNTYVPTSPYTDSADLLIKLEPHKITSVGPRIREDTISSSFGKSYNTHKATLREHWIRDTRDCELKNWNRESGWQTRIVHEDDGRNTSTSGMTLPTAQI
ncbi:hypothetical protein Tco_0851140 [Tanacetum coccineum]